MCRSFGLSAWLGPSSYRGVSALAPSPSGGDPASKVTELTTPGARSAHRKGGGGQGGEEGSGGTGREWSGRGLPRESEG